jgi:hypothetical protein
MVQVTPEIFDVDENSSENNQPQSHPSQNDVDRFQKPALPLSDSDLAAAAANGGDQTSPLPPNNGDRLSSRTTTITSNVSCISSEASFVGELPSADQLNGTRTGRSSLLKRNSSFLSPSGEHVDKPRVGRRLSFSDESGEKLFQTAFSDKLHYSNGHPNFSAPSKNDNIDERGESNCCIIS